MAMNRLIEFLREEIMIYRGLNHVANTYGYDKGDLSRFLRGETKWNYLKVFKLINDLGYNLLIMEMDNVAFESSPNNRIEQ